jgi:hypothetical protein
MWSLGCTLFEAATGTTLFGGLDSVAVAASDDGDESSEPSGGDGTNLWRRRGGGSGGGREEGRVGAAPQRVAGALAVDAAHLALMRSLLGPFPSHLLERAGPAAAAPFFDARGELRAGAAGRRGLEERLRDGGGLTRHEVRGALGLVWAGGCCVGRWAAADYDRACNLPTETQTSFYATHTPGCFTGFLPLSSFAAGPRRQADCQAGVGAPLAERTGVI